MDLKSLFRRKSVENMHDQEPEHEGAKLHKVLTARDIFVAGLAGIIGTGIFILTGTAAHDHAGPAVVLSFILAATASAIVAFAYAELASMIPVSGSAYTYAYATMGELIAWLIGWDLVLEYAVGASCVAVGWSAYLQSVLKSAGFALPEYLSHAPAQVPWISVILAVGFVIYGFVLVFSGDAGTAFMDRFKAKPWKSFAGVALFGAGAIQTFAVATHLNSIDLPAVLIIAALSLWLVRGIRESMRLTSIFVVIKLIVLAIFIAIGMWHIDSANYTPFMPFGFSGMLTGAAVVFFAYIGFDGVTTLAEECKDPQRDLPKGILGSLTVSTLLYVVTAGIMVGAASYTVLGGDGEAAPLAKVLHLVGANWAVPLVSVGALAGLTSVLFVSILGNSRIMMRMAKDGLLPPVFSQIHPTHRTPWISIVVSLIAVGVSAGLLSVSELAVLTNIGTLAAFVLACLGVIVLRKTDPNHPRKFRCPGSPWLPALGALASFGLMCALPALTWIRFFVWMAIGLVVYFSYGRRNSRLNPERNAKR